MTGRRCAKRTPDDAACPYTTVDPKSPYCQWHRLLRTTMNGQEAAAEIRRRAVANEPHRARVPVEQWPQGERWCAGCQSFVPLWYCSGTRCKACARASRSDQNRASTYGLTSGDWDAIMKLQGGKCAICRNRQRDRAPAADHDHAKGQHAVRGGLCVKCNHELLAAAHESPRRLVAALIYLLAPPTSGRWVPPEVGTDDVLRVVGDLLVQMDRARTTRAAAWSAAARVADLDDIGALDVLNSRDELDPLGEPD
jgi:hypothetical protein